MSRSTPANPGARFRAWLGRWFLRLAGWSLEGEAPTERKMVLVAAPHDTNWDLPIALAAAWAFGLDFSWMGKKSLFRWPFGGILRGLGGVSVDRSAPAGVVDAVAARYRETSSMVLAIPPEGTRGQTPYWKSGFYRIALAAQVPILCAFVDYRHRRVGLGRPFFPSGEVGHDMDHIRAFYRDEARLPEGAVATMRLREEAADSPKGGVS